MIDFEQELNDIIEGLGGRLHLERTKAQAHLKENLIAKKWAENRDIVAALSAGVDGLMKSEITERRLGGLLAIPILLEHSEDLVLSALGRCTECLEDPEVRVRMAVGDALGALAAHCGVQVYEQASEYLLGSIRINFDRDEEEEEEEVPNESNLANEGVLGGMLEMSYKPLIPGIGEMRHGTEGWKCLETSFRALTKVMEGCGEAFLPHLDKALISLLYAGIVHMNRFVREISFFGLGTVCSLVGSDGLREMGVEVASKLAKGLSDDWSQVRYSASKSTRIFMQLIPGDIKEELYPHILPQMCINRYYVAEGVKLFSQQTWHLVVGQEGRMWVGKLSPYFVEFYVKQSAANNHAVREAACACIAELMIKVEASCIREFVPRLLNSLINCFKDASWPVRDAACQACGKCVMAFPQESRGVLDELYELWFAHLSDNIGSVREDTAVALGNVVRAYGDEGLNKILPVLNDIIMKAQDQPKESSRFSNLENTTQFGVAAMRRRADDEELHTDQLMYSCGSLAPKLARGGGCMDHGFKREPEPWEASDGAVYLVRELSGVAPDRCNEFLPKLADLSRIGGFMHVHNLHETLWKALPEIAKNIGKRMFKSHLELFLDPLFNAIVCGHQLEEVAAGRAIGRIRDLLGPNIFKGRLGEHQRKLLESNINVPPENGIMSGMSV